MSSPDRSTEHSTESSPTGRRRGRVLIPLAFVVGVLLVMLFIWLVSYLVK